MMTNPIIKFISALADWFYMHITRSAKGLGILCLIALSYWLFFTLGQLSGYHTQIEQNTPIAGTKSLGALVEQANQGQINGKLFIGVKTKLVDQYGNAWIIPDFSTRASASILDNLRQNNIDIIGRIKVELQSEAINHDQIAFNAFLDTAGRISLALVYVVIIYLMFNYLKNNKHVFFPGSRKVVLSHEKVTFKDVAGHEGPKKEIIEVIDYLKNPDDFKRSGAKPPRGVLFYGPPGNGKTLIAKAVAGEAKANYLEQNASTFVQMYVGVGASRVRELFKEARKLSSCVIFIDEIDAVGLSRSQGGSNDERLQTINALLAEMDGFANNNGIVVIAATNRLEHLDEALVRPGRFDRKVLIPLPSKSDRIQILQTHANKLPNCDANMSIWADRTPGFSGADLANLVNEAAVEAARSKKSHVSDPEFEQARERILMGPKNPNHVLNETERKIIAFHEAGHAVIALLQQKGYLEKISILPRGSRLGATIISPGEQEHLLTKEQCINQLRALLAGRACEEIFIHSVSSASSDDLMRASQLARIAVVHYGFESSSLYISENHISKSKEEEASKLITDLYLETKDILQKHSVLVSTLVNKLLSDDEISFEKISVIYHDYTESRSERVEKR